MDSKTSHTPIVVNGILQRFNIIVLKDIEHYDCNIIIFLWKLVFRINLQCLTYQNRLKQASSKCKELYVFLPHSMFTELALIE